MTATKELRHLPDAERQRCMICGGEGPEIWHIITPPWVRPITHYVCPECASKRMVTRSRVEDAIAAWNRRADA